MSLERQIENVLCRCVNRSRKKTARLHGTPGIGWEVTPSSRCIPFALDPRERLKHLYILGSTGSGKTNLLVQLIEEDIRQGKSLVVIDLRGDLVDRLLGQIAGSVSVDKINLIDLRRPDVTAGFNPFQSTSDPDSAALQMHSILKASAESWGVQLDETLRCSLIALAYTRRSLADLPPLLTNRAFRSRILARTPDPNTRSFFDRFDELSPEK